MKYAMLFLFFFSAFQVDGQDFYVLEKNLVYHADVMNHAYKPEHRTKAFDQFYTEFKNALLLPGSYDYPFDSIIWVSKKQPVNKEFRIFTGIADEGGGSFKHFGILQLPSGEIIELHDRLKESEDWEYFADGPEYWMGAMYYSLKEEEEDGQKMYLLFGFHRFDQNENIKLLDVLTFDKKGKPLFGKEIFYRENEGARPTVKSRIVLKYNQESYVGLHYNPAMNVIIHDHLIPRMAMGQKAGLSLVSDGSLVGYEKKGKYWHYIDKIYTQVLDEAPRPKPVLDKRNKDLFGKEQPSAKKKNKEK